MRSTLQALTCLLVVAMPATPAWGRSHTSTAPKRAVGLRCADSGIAATPATTARHVWATFCLLNRARAMRGLPALRGNGRLGRAAGAHARDMVARGYFDHVSPEGSTPESRARSAGYGQRMQAAETICWGAGTESTPAAIVRSWLTSPDHREIVLSPEFREIGIGVAEGDPAGGGGGGVTVTAAFGVRG
jgi:uncharacterized protein YkwD